MESGRIAVDGTFLLQHCVPRNESDQPLRTWQGHRACIECRRKKTRCDMYQPICGLCRRTGGSCTFPTKRKTPEIRRPRGIDSNKHKIDPWRLERLVDLLESRFSDEQLLNALSPHNVASKQSNNGSSDAPLNTPTSLKTSLDHRITEKQPTDRIKSPANLSDDGDTTTSPSSSLQSLGDESSLFTVPEQVITELVHLFFDIIQTWFPLLHRPRFFERYMPNGVFSRKSASRYSDADALLLCSMFSLSARYSSNAYFKDILAPDRGNHFAEDAAKYYERFCISEEGATLEYLQGCLVLAFYLYTSGPCHRAWIVTGVCVRLAYELELCTTDEEEEENWRDPARWSSREERRRAFWLVWTADNFGSIMSRRPSAINRQEVLVRLPVSDVAWFADEPVKSPMIDPRSSKAWKILLDSPNQDEGAWYIVSTYLMVVAFELASARNASQCDRDELVNSITCFSLVLSQRFGLETHASLRLENPASHNWIIGMHLMLTCARGCILSFEGSSGPGISSQSTLSRELSRIVYHWHPEYITLSTPFFAPMMISVRAYPSKQMPPHLEGQEQNNDMANLILARFGSVWKLGSVLLDLRALLNDHVHLSEEQIALAKPFALYFPHNVLNMRPTNHTDSQSRLIANNRDEKAEFGGGLMDRESPQGLLGLLQLSHSVTESDNLAMALSDLGDMPGGNGPGFPLDFSDDWSSRLQLDYVCDDNQYLNYLAL